VAAATRWPRVSHAGVEKGLNETTDPKIRLKMQMDEEEKDLLVAAGGDGGDRVGLGAPAHTSEKGKLERTR
jgi:predicted polyphosphate/ATP-dependent NAD kinase